MKRAKIVFALIAIIALIIIIVQNTASVETRILLFNIRMPRALLLFVMFLLGFGLGVVVTTRFTHRMK